MSLLLAAALAAAAPAAGAADPVSLTAVRDAYPNLSPAGRSLVFHSNRSGRQAIWIAAADGSNAHILYDDPEAGEDPVTPVWSPDGKWIAFAMRPKGATDPEESEIYVMGADGRGFRRLTHAPGDDSHPHWSRDGRIFFNSARATPDPAADWSRQWIDIYSMAADGSGVRRHTDCRTVCTYPVPSPDGRYIAHRKVADTPGLTWELDPGMRNSEVVVTAIDGGTTTNVSDSPAYDGWPYWSPDGKWLVFASNRDKMARTGQIFAVRPDGTGLRALTRGSVSRVQPSFSADGGSLFVYENVETEAFEIGHVARIAVDLPD
jgi:TolB protein